MKQTLRKLNAAALEMGGMYVGATGGRGQEREKERERQRQRRSENSRGQRAKVPVR